MTEYLELLGVVEAIAAGDMTRESMIEMAREALGEIEPGGGLIPHDPLDDEPDDEEPDEEDRPTPSDDEPDICAICGMNRAGGRVCKCMHPDEREEVDSLTCAACADPANGRYAGDCTAEVAGVADCRGEVVTVACANCGRPENAEGICEWCVCSHCTECGEEIPPKTDAGGKPIISRCDGCQAMAEFTGEPPR